MTVALLLALVGAVILVGFLANLLFRLTRIPSVLLLVGIGFALGQLTGWGESEALRGIAPYFGAAALLVILFEGGLELEIAHVIRHAPRTVVLATTVFFLSLVLVAGVARLALGWPTMHALLLGAILAATSPAICMPVASGLSVRPAVKTVIKLESAMGEVLLIVTVVLLLDTHATGQGDALTWARGFAQSLVVALVVSSVAGVLWSRLVGWMGREPLAYMLTLGMVCLLYAAVEELGGSPAIAVLLFGLILANMQTIAGRIGPRLREAIGVDLREDQFVLNQFMVNITAELSFLVRTFFFVYLGLLVNVSLLTPGIAGWVLVIFVLLLVSRRTGLALFSRGQTDFTGTELGAIMALLPRGLATAVVAFMPAQYGVSQGGLFPVFAFAIIVLSNLYMTGGVLFAERRLRRETLLAAPAPAAARTETESVFPAAAPADAVAESAWAPPDGAVREAAAIAEPGPATLSPFSPASEFAGEPPPARFTDWVARCFGLHAADREAEYGDMIRASYLSDALFWIQAVLGGAICALGLTLDQVAIVVGGALIVPMARPVVAMGLALASGDIYLFLRLAAKLTVFTGVVVGVSGLVAGGLPFGVATVEIAARTRPTILDFLVALFGGMSAAALMSVSRRPLNYLPGAVVALTLLPAVCVMGLGLADPAGGAIVRGGALHFVANLFAAVLGASVLLALAGVPAAAESPAVRAWKQAELARPAVNAVFVRLNLLHVVGRTGSLRARLIVVGVFLLAILIPLQTALNQLSMEFRARQAVSRARGMFEQPGRSAVLDSSFTIRPESVDVRIQVATNAVFTDADIRRFEERIADQVGRTARLDLVQTLSDVGRAETIRGMLFEARRAAAPETRTPAESLRESRVLVEGAVAALPVPGDVQVLTVRSDLLAPAGPAVEVVYLAAVELGGDARAVLAQVLADRMMSTTERVSFRWVPATYRLDLTSRGTLDAASGPVIQALGKLLREFDGLDVTAALPAGLPAARAEAVRAELGRALGRENPLEADAAAADGSRFASLRVFRRPAG